MADVMACVRCIQDPCASASRAETILVRCVRVVCCGLRCVLCSCLVSYYFWYSWIIKKFVMYVYCRLENKAGQTDLLNCNNWFSYIPWCCCHAFDQLLSLWGGHRNSRSIVIGCILSIHALGLFLYYSRLYVTYSFIPHSYPTSPLPQIQILVFDSNSFQHGCTHWK